MPKRLGRLLPLRKCISKGDWSSADYLYESVFLKVTARSFRRLAVQRHSAAAFIRSQRCCLARNFLRRNGLSFCVAKAEAALAPSQRAAACAIVRALQRCNALCASRRPLFRGTANPQRRTGKLLWRCAGRAASVPEAHAGRRVAASNGPAENAIIWSECHRPHGSGPQWRQQCPGAGAAGVAACSRAVF